jgi:fluoride ion exporter CrcB/FEX
MQVELLDIVEAHRYALALGYALTSIFAGLVAIWIATSIARRVRVIA